MRNCKEEQKKSTFDFYLDGAIGAYLHSAAFVISNWYDI